MRKGAIISLVLLPLFLSGCVNVPRVLQGTTGNQQVEAKPNNLIVIEKVDVIPSRVFYGDEFNVRVKVSYYGDPKEDEPLSVTVKLENYGICKPTTETSISQTLTLYPGESKIFSFKLKAEEESIEKLKVKCPIKVVVEYRATAKTVAEVKFMKKERYEELEIAGKNPTYIPRVYQSRGPVKIYIDFLGQQPFLFEKSDSSKVSFIVYAKNEGSGEAKVEGKFSISGCGGIPEGSKDLVLSFQSNKETQHVKYTCTFTFSDLSSDEVLKMITATLQYTYRIEKEVPVYVEPPPE